MENMTLEPIEHPSWPPSDGALQGEQLYLHSSVLMGFASPEDPIFQHPGRNLPPDGDSPMGLRPMGPGQLFLTSHRIIFYLVNNSTLSVLWGDLRSVDTLMDAVFNVGSENGAYGFVLKGQSVLKWLAHTRLLIEQMENGNGHRIYQGYV